MAFFLFLGLDISKDTNQHGLNIWHLSNKYFETDVHICCCKAKDFVENFSLFTKMEAVLYVFENKVCLLFVYLLVGNAFLIVSYECKRFCIYCKVVLTSSTQ